MRKQFLFLPIAAVVAASAAHAMEMGHRATDERAAPQGTPMAWRYRTLAAGLDAFERQRLALAPGASLAFALPKVEGAKGEHMVVLQRQGEALALPMVGHASFALTRDQQAFDEDAQVVTNRHFEPGSFNHPNVQVRTPGLAPDTRRLGDLRLACATQIAMGRNDSFKLKAVLGALSVFLGNLCDRMSVMDIDVPDGAFDSIVLEDGARRVVQKTGGADAQPIKLGDGSWSHDTRIRFAATPPAQ